MSAVDRTNDLKSNTYEALLFEVLYQIQELQNDPAKNPGGIRIIESLTRDDESGEVSFSGSLRIDSFLSTTGLVVTTAKNEFL